jgi:phytoene synthase
MSPAPPLSDLSHCHALLRRGSASFHAAALALPARLRDPIAALYAFCRVSDDAVDEGERPREALHALGRRLDRIFAGRPDADAVDRALAWAAEAHGLPRAPLDALLDGYAWDVERRPIETLSDLYGYAARVAASVGVATTHLFGVHDERVLARAIDLGVALQLVNVARDVGEDAGRGRLYLPRAWLRASGWSAEAFLEAPTAAPAIRAAILRLLDAAEVLGARALGGVPYLPAEARIAVRSAARIYLDIGRILRERGGDGVSSRASTSPARKAVLVAAAIVEDRADRRRPIVAPVLPEASFLLATGPDSRRST